MSSTGRAGERLEKDGYYSPYWTLSALFDMLSDRPDSHNLRGKVALDPCVGDGRVLFMAQQYGATSGVGVEIRPEAAESARVHGYPIVCGDALQEGMRPSLPPWDVLVTNPAFSLAREFITEYALTTYKPTWWQLPSDFLASEERHYWLRENMPAEEWAMSARPSYIAVCQGIPASKRQKRAAVRRCGAKYPKDTKGTCPCGGRIGNGVDSVDYSWFCWEGPGRTSTITRLLPVFHLDRSY